MNHLLALVLLLVLSSNSMAEASPSLKLKVSCGDDGTRATETLSFDGLKHIICSQGLLSPDDVMAYFKSQSDLRPYLENPVLLRTSRALHAEEVTPNFPRIVMFGGNLIMQTVGDLTKAASNTIEIIEYLPIEMRFRFAVINFNALGYQSMFVPEAAFLDFSTLEPADLFKGSDSCSKCHYASRGLDPKTVFPRWNPYPIYLQAYGRIADTIDKASQEFQHWRSFKAELAGEGGARYRLLDLSPVVDLGDRVVFTASPNQKLGQQINRHKAEIFYGRIVASPKWPRLSNAVKAVLRRQGRGPEFLQKSYRTQHERELKAFLMRKVKVERRSWVPVEWLVANHSLRGKVNSLGEIRLRLREFIEFSAFDLYQSLDRWVRVSRESSLEYRYALSKPGFEEPFPTGQWFDRMLSTEYRFQAQDSIPSHQVVVGLWYLLGGELEAVVANLGFGSVIFTRTFDHGDGNGGIIPILAKMLAE